MIVQKSWNLKCEFKWTVIFQGWTILQKLIQIDSNAFLNKKTKSMKFIIFHWLLNST